jgi:hypothetical protein
MSCISAVDDKRAAGDPAPRRGKQKSYRMGDIDWFAEPQGMHRFHCRNVFWVGGAKNSIGHGRANQRRDDAIHADLLARELERQRFGEGDERTFARRVRSDGRLANKARYRADEHGAGWRNDHPLLPKAAHKLQSCAGIDSHYRLEIRWFERPHATERVNSRGVNQSVQPTDALTDFLDAERDLLGICQIERFGHVTHPGKLTGGMFQTRAVTR